MARLKGARNYQRSPSGAKRLSDVRVLRNGNRTMSPQAPGHETWCYPFRGQNECRRRMKIGEPFMRKRFQRGSVRKIHGSWNGRYYDENGKRVPVTLGRVSEMTKSEAREKLAEILRPITAGAGSASSEQT